MIHQIDNIYYALWTNKSTTDYLRCHIPHFLFGGFFREDGTIFYPIPIRPIDSLESVRLGQKMDLVPRWKSS